MLTVKIEDPDLKSSRFTKARNNAMVLIEILTHPPPAPDQVQDASWDCGEVHNTLRAVSEVCRRK